MTPRAVLVTGAGGYLGTQLLAGLAEDREPIARLVALDVREVPASQRLTAVDYRVADVRAGAELKRIFDECRPDVVVHLASIVTPGKGSRRSFEYEVDVGGSANVLAACRAAGVRRIVVTSSGAAYGYHADNPAWIDEDWPLRGNEAFAYAHHKRLVEEMLARWRVELPQLEQVVFRVGTILGETVHNQITALFDKSRLIAIRGADSPFVFVWDRDVVGCIRRAIGDGPAGIYNVAGDGALTIHQIAAQLGKPVVELPASVLRAALALLASLRLTAYGPAQVDFLRYRPVLDNTRLKRDFGYVPALSSAEVFDLYLRSHGHRVPT
jgi:UDP-glucose 4-epimerase